MKLFKSKNRALVDYLNLEVVNLINRLEKAKHFNNDLNVVIANMTNCINELKTTLKSTSNELTEANKTIEEQKTEIMLLKKEILHGIFF